MDRTSTIEPGFYLYELTAETLCLGERIRAGVFRPCLRVFTSTALAGALKARFPHPNRSIHCVARFRGGIDRDGFNVPNLLTFSPRDRAIDSSTIPLEIEFLSNVRAEACLAKNDLTRTWPAEFDLYLGAMKSKGFGHCRLRRIDEIPLPSPQRGRLICRIPDTDDLKNIFGIRNVIAPVYGYLFQPERGGTGHYARALFEDTLLEAYPFLLRKEHATP